MRILVVGKKLIRLSRAYVSEEGAVRPEDLNINLPTQLGAEAVFTI